METEVTSAALQKLLGINKSTLSELVQDGIVVRGEKRGSYAVASITRYCEHLRVMAAGRGGEDASAARARLGAAQADLASTKTAKMRGELVETDAVEKLWITKMKAFRARILGHPANGPISERAADRVLTQELRAALTEWPSDLFRRRSLGEGAMLPAG